MDYIHQNSVSSILLEYSHRLNTQVSLPKPCFKKKGELCISMLNSKLNDYENLRVRNKEGTGLNPEFEVLKTLYFEEAIATQVDLLFHPATQEYFILKKILKSKLLCPEHFESAARELQIHSELSHPNIVYNFDVFESPTEFMELLEFVPRANYFVKKLEENNIPFMVKPDGGIQKLKSFSFDILQGLKFLHSINIIHMDIKPANLLLSAKFNDDEYPLVKICDFGLSKIADEEGKAFIKLRCGTELYIAPEVRSESFVTTAVDMWSFGIFLHVLTVGYSPVSYSWKPGNPLRRYERHWRKYEGTGLFDLIEKCLKLDPVQRITAAEALNHQWLTS
jgi:serine/threonine protein kinase